MTGIENGIHRSIHLLVPTTLLLSACGSLPARTTETPQPTIIPPPRLLVTAAFLIFLFASCAPKAAPVPTVTPSPAAARTATPVPHAPRDLIRVDRFCNSG